MPASSGGSSTFPTPDEMAVLSQSSESTSGGTCDDLSSSGYQIHDCSLGSSCRPIRYFNGGMVLSETDISSSGVGMPWSHRRSFMNQMDQNGCLNNGNNWLPASGDVLEGRQWGRERRCRGDEPAGCVLV
ncbi:MAG: hypothetical protein R3E01_15455 [Pirellulaceae bacterium]